mmetsp:Transcript_62255/g.172362  ORF Transcript_62255/g.172362 Transcript_62255/m.172362 type:complete len:224 (-) Transcript_62255:513-1184(-)
MPLMASEPMAKTSLGTASSDRRRLRRTTGAFPRRSATHRRHCTRRGQRSVPRRPAAAAAPPLSVHGEPQATGAAWRLRRLAAEDVALRPLDLLGARAAIAHHAGAPIEGRVPRAARDLSGVQALLREGLHVLRAVLEEVDLLRLDADALPPVPLADELDGLLLHLVALLQHEGRVHACALGPLPRVRHAPHEGVVHLPPHDMVEQVVVPRRSSAAAMPGGGDA